MDPFDGPPSVLAMSEMTCDVAFGAAIFLTVVEQLVKGIRNVLRAETELWRSCRVVLNSDGWKESEDIIIDRYPRRDFCDLK